MTNCREYRKPISLCSTSGKEWSSPVASTPDWLAKGVILGRQEIQAVVRKHNMPPGHLTALLYGAVAIHGSGCRIAEIVG